MALLTLLAATHQTLQSYVDPIFDRQILTQEFGQKLEIGINVKPSGSCLPSLLVIQSIRRVSRQRRLGKLESSVNSEEEKGNVVDSDTTSRVR